MLFPEDLQDLLQLLRDNGVVEYKTPELSLLLTVKPDKALVDQTATEEVKERRASPLPPLPKGSGYSSLPTEFIPSFPGAAKPIPVANVRIPTPTPGASTVHDAVLEAAEAQFIASNAEG